MNTDVLRQSFLDFFKTKEHKVFPSDSLVPDDPSVLFTSAGMNQFKPYFLGEKKDIKRAVSCKKCLRTGDLEKVGKTAYHHTFFEMLGNFSFGGYFKKEAIGFAWEFITKELNMKEKDLWVSVYEEDTEAYALWKDFIGLPHDKVIKLDQETNFWPANAPKLGPNGPCGPCSEIFVDKGKTFGCLKDECNPSCNCGRFVELWNLVFTQFNRTGEDKLAPLPQKNIDTGMGLERMASVLQHKESNFEIDILYPAVVAVKEILKISGDDFKTKSLINAIVDHARAAVFSIAYGVYPSNEERGYVVRKIIRKALWSANILKYKEPFIYILSDLFSRIMQVPYPELGEKKEIIARVIKEEEERFLSTLREGKEHFLTVAKTLKMNSQKAIDSAELFRLYDTYGFPLELSKELAQENNISVNEKGFLELLKKQQELSRKKSMFDVNIFKQKSFALKEKSEFVGYEKLEVENKIIKLFVGEEENECIKEGEGLVILDKTPFYPESGGQLTDKGWIKTNEGEFLVEEVFKAEEAIVHKGRVIRGEIRKGKAFSSVNPERRSALMRAHTATHLLQAALRNVLGEHVMQQGSLVDEDRLHFDFTHFEALTYEQLARVEALVNEYILSSYAVAKKNLSFTEAKKQGALAFFKDKYGEKVKVVFIAGISKELCGGTHLDNTSGVGSFSLVSESSISSGIRRIEALTGKKAYLESKEIKERLERIASLLRCDMRSVPSVAMSQQEKLKRKDEYIALLEKGLLSSEAKAIASKRKVIQGINFLAEVFSPKSSLAAIEESIYSRNIVILSDLAKEGISSIFVFLAVISSDEKKFICSVSDDLAKRGLTAKRFISLFKDELFLRGGGRDNLVQGAIEKTQDDFLGKLENCFYKFLTQ